MRLSEDKIRRIVERVHDGLEERELLAYKDSAEMKRGEARAARIKRIYDFVVADLQREEEIDREVEDVLNSYSRTIKGTERDILFRKHKEEIARKKGYIL